MSGETFFLTEHQCFFDNILFVDNSKQNEIYTNLLQIEKGEFVLMTVTIPDYFKRRLPDVFKLIE